MRSETYDWKKQQSIAEDYLNDFGRVRSLFEYDPWDEAVLEQRTKWLDEAAHLRVDRGQFIKVLRNYNQSIDNSKEALEAVSWLEDPRTLAVVGGQQSGLFTGPLLVIYKAITLIQAAKKASSRLNRKVIPVFWIAGEDHDFDEVNHIHYLSQQLNVEKIKLEHPTGKKTSVSHISMELNDWENVINQLNDSLIDTEFKPGLIHRLREISQKSSTLTDFFARIMAWLFGKHGLILLDSSDLELRKLEGPLFQSLIKQHKHVNESLLKGRKRVESLGYEPQAEVLEGQANLFFIHEENRVLLKQSEDGFADKKEQLFFSQEQLIEIAQTSPEQFSNNVFTRPIMQEYLLPVLSTVLGPGEISYWGLIAEAFHVMDMKMPVITPRREFTLLEGTIQKHMSKYELSFDEIIYQFDDKKQAWLDAQDTLRIDQRFDDVKQQFANLYDPLLETVAKIHTGIQKLGETNKQKIIEQIEFLQSRTNDAFQSQYEASLRQLERIHLSILPLGKPQERVYNIFVYLNKYGTDWLDEVICSPVEDNKLHTIIYF